VPVNEEKRVLKTKLTDQVDTAIIVILGRDGK
jgi:hypothetical protein